MSNFVNFSPVSSGLPGTAQQIFTGSTTDNFATVTATGYLNDRTDEIKEGDLVYLNWSDDGVGGGTRQLFKAHYVSTDLNLVPVQASAVATFAGGGTAQTITDANIVSTSRVIVQARSTANAAYIRSVLPGTGSAAVTWSADPGSSVVQYVVFN